MNQHIGTGPVVSVIMVVHNGARYLTQAIDSVLSQTFQEFELIVVDDGSTDDTPSLLSSYGDSRISVRREEWAGLTQGLNVAAHLATGLYLARMDADDRCLPDRLSAQVEFLRRNPRVAVVGTTYQVIDEAGAVLGPELVPTDHQDIIRTLRTAGNCLAHGSIMMRRRVFQEVGGYRAFFQYAQDYDLYLRVAEAHQLANLPETLYQWRLDPNCITLTHYREQQLSAMLARSLAANRALGIPEDPSGTREAIAADCELKRRDLTQRRLRRDLYCGWGANYLAMGDVRLARARLLMSLKTSVCNPRAAGLLVLSAMPPRAVGRFRRTFQRARRLRARPS